MPIVEISYALLVYFIPDAFDINSMSVNQMPIISIILYMLIPDLMFDLFIAKHRFRDVLHNQLVYFLFGSFIFTSAYCYSQVLISVADSITTLTGLSGVFGIVFDSNMYYQIVASVVLMNGHEGKIYTLTGPEAMDHRGFEHILSGVTGNLVKYYPVSPEDYEKDLKLKKIPDFKIGAMSVLYASIRNSEWELVTDDVRLLTGKRARSLTQFSNDYRKEFKGN